MTAKVSQGGTTRANYAYLYDGTKLSAVNSAGQGFDYLGSLVYNRNGASSTLESAAFGAGRIVKTSGSGSSGYEVRYFITDHLGSVRGVVNNRAQLVERSDYQLLGERWNGIAIQATNNRYAFNGKESQTLLASTNGISDFLDYGARHYNARTGRWSNPDPLSEKFPDLSSYVYCANNSINSIDPDGMDWYSVTKQDANGNEIKESRFSTEFRSQQDIKKAGIEGKYIGLTGKTSDKGRYLSLLGEQFDKTNTDGSVNNVAKMVENIDNAVINYYRSEYLNEQANQDPFNQDVYSSATDMSVRYITSSDITFNRHIRVFAYFGGTVRYWMSNNAERGTFDWGKGNVKELSGFNDSGINGATAFVESSKNYKPVAWTFQTTESWRKAKDLVVKLMTGRKW